MATRRLIRLLVYEGEEEVVNAYEEKALKGTRHSGVPKYWRVGMLDKHIKLTAETIKETNPPIALLREFRRIIKQHENTPG
jgi:hypothetical protein